MLFRSGMRVLGDEEWARRKVGRERRVLGDEEWAEEVGRVWREWKEGTEGK